MPFNGSGVFQRAFNWVNDAANGILITASRVDSDSNDFASGLSNCITRDGQGKPTAAQNWNGQNLTNVAALGMSGPLSGATTISASGTVSTTETGAVDAQVAASIASVGGIVIGANNSASGNAYGAMAGSAYVATGGPFPLDFVTAGNTRFRIDLGGRLSGFALHNNSTLPTGTTNQYIASGTYTPTLTNVSNFSAITALAAQWIRVGNVVTVSGEFTAAGAASSQCLMGISLPIPSVLAANPNAAGSLVKTATAGLAGYVLADTANARAQAVIGNDGNAGGTGWVFHFTYVIL